MLTILKLISLSPPCQAGQENQMSKSQRKKFMKDKKKPQSFRLRVPYYMSESGPHESLNCLLIEHEVGEFLC